MTVTATQAATAVEAAVQTWGGRRRTPDRADQLSLDGIVGAALDILGLLPLVPVADRGHRDPLPAVLAMAPELARHLDSSAVLVLSAAQAHDAAGRTWRDTAHHTRSYCTDLEAVALAEAETGAPPTMRAVHVRQPRTDQLPPCPADSPPVQVLGDVTLVFGCADVEGHHPERAHVWALTW